MPEGRSIVPLCIISFLLLQVALAQPSALQQVASHPPPATSLAARRAKLREAIEEEWQYQLRTHPEFATAISDPRYNDRLDDRSTAAEEEAAHRAREEVRLFGAIDTSAFPE